MTSFCNKCGHLLNVGDRFCPGCGKPIVGQRSSINWEKWVRGIAISILAAIIAPLTVYWFTHQPSASTTSPATSPSGIGTTSGYPATPTHQGQLVGHIVQGPATIKAYNPTSCGKFQITSVQTYDPSTTGETAGYYWEYASDADNNANWPQHNSDFLENQFKGQQCHISS